MEEYRVNLDIFNGPLDLLLYLVRKEEVDIYDIPISRITEQYVKYIEMLKLLDIDIAGEFLVMAASLMEIKSAMLLPKTETGDESDDDLTDPRKELIRQLLEYKKFKDAAMFLDESAKLRQERHVRPDTIISHLKSDEEPELDLEQVSIWTLLEAFDSIMQSIGDYQNYEHISDDTPIDLYQIEILHNLQSEGPMVFKNLFKNCSNKLELVGMFLGLLELIKSQLIWAEQEQSHAPIYLRALTDEPAETAVQEAILRNQLEDEAKQETVAQEPDESMNQQGRIPIVEIPAEKSHDQDIAQPVHPVHKTDKE